MLNFIYYPVSGIMWVWYKVFGFLLGPTNGIAWALSVVFLVFTLRAIIYWPAVKQIRTTRQMQELQPQIKALKKKYGNDRQRMALEMQKLQKEHGFNPLLGCLPMLVQAPVFIGLYHVLRSFNRTGGVTSSHIPFVGSPVVLTPEQNANTANYVFSAADVQNFLHAHLFGVPLSAYIAQPMKQLEAFASFGGVPERWQIAALAIPLMIIAAIATHMNARASVARQSVDAAAQPQAAIMNKLALYIFPLGVLVSGAFLPIAILFYWVSNNAWTVVQQHFVFKTIAKEEEEKKQRALESRAARAPKPGARPNRPKKPGAAAAVVDSEAGVDGDVSDAEQVTESGDVSLSKPAPKKAGPAKNKPASGAKAAPPGKKAPAPGARPAGDRNKSTKRKRR
ncbi:membrane protein insertase YidC [Rhodococcus sp. D2-41]|uniref:Membrane protein insertase YidC n=1 Tax=Speluncibacter jeojiensis TaxID=2710754 RepID=A0A9X4M1E2_9ACTN|nr:membrane protein insertase YidC [Rhodococcus sp. D2-41]MDG3009826.1 membrane protein insertase YidC [Rhodococcus sp. D2-41]MDG3014577.1 membrane protein insertase YidC [Corynebacteriales bacterium D3-21]